MDARLFTVTSVPGHLRLGERPPEMPVRECDPETIHAQGIEVADLPDAIVRRVVLEKDCARLEIGIAGLRQLLDVVDQGAETSPQDTHSLAVPFTLRRRGSELKLVIEGGADATPGRIDPVLIKLIDRAHDWMQLLTSGRTRSIKELAEREGLTGSYITRVMRLSILAPDIVVAIVEGRQPPDLTAKTLLRGIDLPVSWEEQRTALRFRPA